MKYVIFYFSIVFSFTNIHEYATILKGAKL